MNAKKYRPKIDKYFYIIWIPMAILMISMTIISTISTMAFIIMLCTDIFTFYFMISSLVGYVELRENFLYIKFGFILKKDIPYNTILEINKERRIITYNMLSMKNALEHVNIKYNKYDWVTVSVNDNDEFIKELKYKMNPIDLEH